MTGDPAYEAIVAGLLADRRFRLRVRLYVWFRRALTYTLEGLGGVSSLYVPWPVLCMPRNTDDRRSSGPTPPPGV